MPDTVNIVPYTGPALDCAGPGYFEGVCTAAGEPQQNVMIQAVHSVTGAPAGHTVSGPDGRWRLEGVNPTMDFDILYRGEAIGKYGQIHQKRRPILDNNISFYPDRDPLLHDVEFMWFCEGGEIKTFGNKFDNKKLGRYKSAYMISNKPVTIDENYPFKEGIIISDNKDYIKLNTFQFNSLCNLKDNDNYTYEFTVTITDDFPLNPSYSLYNVLPSITNNPNSDALFFYVYKHKNNVDMYLICQFGSYKIQVPFRDAWKNVPIHVALVKINSDATLYVNGKKVEIISGIRWDIRFSHSGNSYNPKVEKGSYSYCPVTKGIYHNFRITKGVRYTKDFYPPNKQFSIIDNDGNILGGG